MSPRFAPLSALVLLFVAACATPAQPASTPAPTAAPTTVAEVAPTPTPVPVAGARTPPATGPSPTPTPNAGDVDGWGDGPALTVEFPGDQLLDVTLEDAKAKAWRVVVSGTGDLAGDRFEVVVETGDVGPVINATEVQGGEVVDVLDLSFFGDDTAAAGGCHRTLEVCVDSSSFTFADDETGRLRVRLAMPKPGDASLLVTGGTAGWPGEPFVLGPWSETEAYPWGEG